MKPIKKQKKILPEVHIIGDLQDVKNLISGVNKKKTIVIFLDGDDGTFYLEMEGKIQQILQRDVVHLGKEYRVIFFTFFPSRKKVESMAEEKSETREPEKSEIAEEEEKTDKKVKEVKKDKKAKKGKKGKKKAKKA